MRKLRAARVAESEAETGTGTETETVDEDSSAEAAQSGGDGQPRTPDASSSAPRRATLFQSVSRGAASLLGGGVFFDRDRDEGGSRAGRCTPRVSLRCRVSRAPSFGDVGVAGPLPPRLRAILRAVLLHRRGVPVQAADSTSSNVVVLRRWW